MLAEAHADQVGGRERRSDDHRRPLRGVGRAARRARVDEALAHEQLIVARVHRGSHRRLHHGHVRRRVLRHVHHHQGQAVELLQGDSVLVAGCPRVRGFWRVDVGRVEAVGARRGRRRGDLVARCSREAEEDAVGGRRRAGRIGAGGQGSPAGAVGVRHAGERLRVVARRRGFLRGEGRGHHEQDETEQECEGASHGRLLVCRQTLTALPELG